MDWVNSTHFHKWLLTKGVYQIYKLGFLKLSVPGLPFHTYGFGKRKIKPGKVSKVI